MNKYTLKMILLFLTARWPSEVLQNYVPILKHLMAVCFWRTAFAEPATVTVSEWMIGHTLR